MTICYYDRQGNPMTLDEWIAAVETRDTTTRRVAEDEVGDVWVSTVWLGLNHNTRCDGPPLIFETMVFGGEHDQEAWRYSTEVEAQAGHVAIVESLRAAAETAR